MTIRAQILADSVNEHGDRLTTFQLRYPRFIHAELMTHRLFSRNASSSRAIPVKRLIEDLIQDPAIPLHWGKSQPGMQAREELDDHTKSSCLHLWLKGMEDAILRAEELIAQGLHKQIANRILEPWAHINVVLTSTHWANWFALRDHPDAQPEIAALAGAMKQAMGESEPRLLQPFQWHLPYIRPEDIEPAMQFSHNHSQEHGDSLAILQKVSVARCARVSYLTHEGKETSIAEDVALYTKLAVSQPLHVSPAEHQATPDIWSTFHRNWSFPNQHGNFTGWRQLRKLLPNEFVHDLPYRASQPSTYVA